MHDMVVIGKADQLPVRAEDMYVAATAQRAWSIGRGDIHRIQIAYLTVMRNHPLAMMKIVAPVRVRVFRAVDKDVFILCRMNGHHANVRAVRSAINHLDLARAYVNSFDGFTGERRP